MHLQRRESRCLPGISRTRCELFRTSVIIYAYSSVGRGRRGAYGCWSEWSVDVSHSARWYWHVRCVGCSKSTWRSCKYRSVIQNHCTHTERGRGTVERWLKRFKAGTWLVWGSIHWESLSVCVALTVLAEDTLNDHTPLWAQYCDYPLPHLVPLLEHPDTVLIVVWGVSFDASVNEYLCKWLWLRHELMTVCSPFLSLSCFVGRGSKGVARVRRLA